MVIENDFDERSDSCQAEDQVRYGEIDQPYISDIVLHTETGNPDDHSVPNGAEENNDGEEDNAELIHNVFSVHFSVHMVMGVMEKSCVGGHSTIKIDKCINVPSVGLFISSLFTTRKTKLPWVSTEISAL